MENKFPSEIIELPSQGYFYPEDNPLSSGKVEIKYMTAKEEDILTSKNLIQKGVVLDVLLKSLIVSPIKYEDLLNGDKNAILIASRILAYGKDYEVSIECPHCKEKSSETFDLTEIPNKEIDTTIFKKNSMIYTYQLPYSKKVLELKLFTHADERLIENELKSYKKISNKNGVDPEVTTRLRYMIVSIDGNSDKKVINDFVNTELLSKDSFELRQFSKKILPDVDMKINFECSACGKSSEMQLPLDINFFWPSSRD